MTNITIGLALGLFVGALVNALIAGRFWRRDRTDRIGRGGEVITRSGLMIFTDHGTGVQYVGMPLVGISVRLDASGKPMTVSRDSQ